MAGVAPERFARIAAGLAADSMRRPRVPTRADCVAAFIVEFDVPKRTPHVPRGELDASRPSCTRGSRARPPFDGAVAGTSCRGCRERRTERREASDDPSTH